MDNLMLEDIKELFQSFIAPQLEGIKGDIRALDTKLDVRVDALDSKIESFRRELLAEIHRVEESVHRVEKTLSSDFVRLEQKVDIRLGSFQEIIDLRLGSMEQKVDLRLGSIDERLELFRREMLAEIKASVK